MQTGGILLDRNFAKLIDEAKTQYRKRVKLPVSANGLCFGAEVSLIAEAVRQSGARPCLIIAGSDREAYALNEALAAEKIKCEHFGQRELVLYNITASRTTEYERLSVLYDIMTANCDAIVTTAASALQFIMPQKALSDAAFVISENDTLDIEELCIKLTKYGYEFSDTVEAEGQFSRRGGIVDVYSAYRSADAGHPVRIEFFGDSIDRMSRFDAGTQRVIDNIKNLTVIPAREVLPDEEDRKEIIGAIKSLISKTKNEQAKKELEGELSAAEGGIPMLFADKYIPLIYKEKGRITDYISDDAFVFVVGESAVKEQITAAVWQHKENIKTLLEAGTILGKYTSFGFDAADFEYALAKKSQMYVNNFSSGAMSDKLAAIFNFRSRQTVNYGRNPEMLKEDVAEYVRGKYRITVGCANEDAAKNIADLLRDSGFAVSERFSGDIDVTTLAEGVANVVISQSPTGYELMDAKFVCLSASAEKENRSRLRRRFRNKKNAGEKIISYADLKVGDYVVHEAYGIGKYLGLETLTVDGNIHDYITIQYAGTDKLFIPADRLELVSKYIGAHSDDGLVKLSKMGGADWVKQKSKAKAAVRGMAKELIALYAERSRKEGYSFPKDDEFQREFEASFDYEETDSQLEACDEIKHDMERSMPMDRLLCGDVGYGKTEVAFRAAFKAVSAGKQVAMLVPTTILAYQHYQTARSRFADYAMRIEMLSRFVAKKDQDSILRRAKRGDVDILIGTHKLLYGEIAFKDLGLLIVDEEQRFGVAQKERLKQLCTNIDVLSLSATPIPRTLNMAMGGIRDMSVLDEAPGDRHPVQTYVLEHDDIIINEAISKEITRGGQVFYLYNRVETIYNVAARIMRDIPNARVAVAHGKMEREEIEDIWQALLDGEVDVLVCTTIIETGVDVPNANTLIIENADRMGLSQLHQIRGRVGRSSRRAYAYFTYRKGKVLSEISEKRLEAIREYAEFGAGFKIALRDLEIRGAGNLLGSEQHGHIDTVGYDLFIKLLHDAVLEEKGEEKPEKKECVVDIKTDAYIPDTYITHPPHRMEQYKRIALIGSEDDLYDVADELCDRYGSYPDAVENLLNIALIKALAEKTNIVKVEQAENELRFTPEKLDIDAFSRLSLEFEEYRLRLVMIGAPYLACRLKNKGAGIDTALKILKKYCEICLQNNQQDETAE